jgi:DNA-binding transcriptional LysR family regulator
LVDLVEEGYDVVIRNGAATDSRLMRRSLGSFAGQLVASPDYLEKHGRPERPADLARHACLRQRSSATGKLMEWPLDGRGETPPAVIPETLSANTIEPLIYLTKTGHGLAFLPLFAVAPHITDGTLVSLLDEYVYVTGEFAALWPNSRQLSPRDTPVCRFPGPTYPI